MERHQPVVVPVWKTERSQAETAAAEKQTGRVAAAERMAVVDPLRTGKTRRQAGIAVVEMRTERVAVEQMVVAFVGPFDPFDPFDHFDSSVVHPFDPFDLTVDPFGLTAGPFDLLGLTAGPFEKSRMDCERLFLPS